MNEWMNKGAIMNTEDNRKEWPYRSLWWNKTFHLYPWEVAPVQRWTGVANSCFLIYTKVSKTLPKLHSSSVRSTHMKESQRRDTVFIRFGLYECRGTNSDILGLSWDLHIGSKQSGNCDMLVISQFSPLDICTRSDFLRKVGNLDFCVQYLHF